MTCSPCNLPGSFTAGALADYLSRSPEYLSQQLVIRMPKTTSYLFDMIDKKVFPDGVGRTIQKETFYLNLTPNYWDFNGWTVLADSRAGTDLIPGNDACNLPTQEFEPAGSRRAIYDTLAKKLATKEFCLEDIRSKFEFGQKMNAITSFLQKITIHELEMLARNAILNYSIKYILSRDDSTLAIGYPDGVFPYNKADPRRFPNLTKQGGGLLPVGVLSGDSLQLIYDLVYNDLVDYALDTQDMKPVFGLWCSSEVWSRIFISDVDVRQDVRWSSFADALLTKYNVRNSYRGMFTHTEIAKPIRANVTTAGDVEYVSPILTDLPTGEVGVHTTQNPAWSTAIYEVIFVITKSMIEGYTRPDITRLGLAEFGALGSLMDGWKWFSPKICGNEEQQKGYFFKRLELAPAMGDVPYIAAFLVKREKMQASIVYGKEPVCPPTDSCPVQILTTDACPCATIIDVCETIDPNALLFTLSEAVVDGVYSITLLTGGTVDATASGASGNKGVFTFAFPVPADRGLFVGINCAAASTVCSSNVISSEQVIDQVTQLSISLVNTVVCATDIFTLYFADGTTGAVAVASTSGGGLTTVVDANLNIGTVPTAIVTDNLYTFACVHGGVTRVCCLDDGTCDCDALAPIVDCDPEA